MDRGAMSWILDAREAQAWQVSYGIFRWLAALMQSSEEPA